LARKPVTARWCAEHWGVSEAQARRILAPVTPVGRHPKTRAMLYDPAAAKQARTGMPGRGARTDLAGRPVEHGVAGYRAGCPCSVCRSSRAEAAAAKRHTERYGPTGPLNATVRRRVLQLVRSGHTVQVAAERVGVSHQAIYGAARALPQFGSQLDAGLRPTG
jgi:hypothetical protein